jgi:two-component system NtrC family sensor kinase
VPQAESAAEEDCRKRLAQEMSRLQSTLEYLLLKGDEAGAQHEIAVLAHNHDYNLVALTDDRQAVIAGTRHAWLGRQIADVLPSSTSSKRRVQSVSAVQASRSTLKTMRCSVMRASRCGDRLIELRPSKTGSLFLAYDLGRYKAEARAQVLQQSLYWAGWVTILALALWLVFHFLLTRRTAQLVLAAERLASGNLTARSELKGSDELGRLGRAFDAMAVHVAGTQTRLREDIAERARVQEALREQ